MAIGNRPGAENTRINRSAFVAFRGYKCKGARGRTCWTGTRSYTCLCTTLRFFFLMFDPPFQTLSSLSRGCGFLCKFTSHSFPCFIYLYLPRTRRRSLHMKWREITWNFVTGNEFLILSGAKLLFQAESLVFNRPKFFFTEF